MTARRFSLFLLLLVLSACGSLSTPPRDTFYRLSLLPVAESATRSTEHGVVFVAPFSASGLHTERALIYAHEDGTSLEQSAYHLWVDSPRRMLQLALVEYLEAALGVNAVSEPQREVERTIRGRVVHFERHKGGAGGAAVALQLDVLAGADKRVLLSRRYERVVDVNGDSMSAAVAGINAATAEIFAQFAADLSALD